MSQFLQQKLQRTDRTPHRRTVKASRSTHPPALYRMHANCAIVSYLQPPQAQRCLKMPLRSTYERSCATSADCHNPRSQLALPMEPLSFPGHILTQSTVAAAAQPTAAKVADVFGRAELLMLSVFFYIVGTIIEAVAGNMVSPERTLIGRSEGPTDHHQASKFQPCPFSNPYSRNKC